MPNTLIDVELRSRGLIVPGGLVRVGNQGAMIFGGRSAATRSNETATVELAMELPCAAEELASVSLIVGGAAPAASTPQSIIADIKTIGALTDLDNAWTGVTAATWLGGAGAYLGPGATTARRAHQISDDAAVSVTSRTDGGTRALVAARGYYGQGYYNFFGNNSQDFSNWATRAAGRVRLRVNSTAGDQRTATANWGNSLYSPMVGFAYTTLRPHILLATFGDSIAEGQGTYIGASHTLLSCEALNAASPQTLFSHMNLAWSGQVTTNFVAQMRDAFRHGIVPSIAVFPCGSPNDVGNATITAAQIALMEANLDKMLALCVQYGVVPIVTSWIPTNSSVNNYGTSDSLRVAYNARVKAKCAAYGIPYADTDAAMSGTTSGGQVQMLAGNTDDNIHPNDTGKVTMQAVVQPVIAQVAGALL